jgi:hypothetical protein
MEFKTKAEAQRAIQAAQDEVTAAFRNLQRNVTMGKRARIEHWKMEVRTRQKRACTEAARIRALLPTLPD